MPVEDDEQSQNYVMCRATLTAWTRDYAWFDDSSFGHDDGVAPLASFVLVEPSTHTERDMDILFNYAEDAAKKSLLGAADIGRQFTVQIPRDFLTGCDLNASSTCLDAYSRASRRVIFGFDSQ